MFNDVIISRTIKQIIIFLALSSIAGFKPVVMAGVYKWVDAEGKVHYGGQRPAGVQSERMKIKTGTPDVDNEVASKTSKDGQAGDKAKTEGKKEEKQKAQKKPEPAKPPKLSRKEKARRCKQARSALATIQSHGQIRERDEKGNVRYLPDKEKQQRITAAKKNIRKHCR